MSATATFGRPPTQVLRRELARVGAVAAKDLLTEWRSRAALNGVALLGVLILLLFGFALGPDAAALRRAAAGVVWLAVLFSGILAFHRGWQLELDGGALDQLLLYPGERAALFLGKTLANLAFVLAVELVVLPLGAVLYHVPAPPQPAALLGVLLLGTVGFVTLGTFYAAITSRTRAREVLLPLLLLPVLVPVLVAAVSATDALLAGDVMGDARAWARLLAAFDLVFLVAAVLAFGYVIDA